jgi:Domain of unknown function (DUF4260)
VVERLPSLLLRLEGLAVAGGALALYAHGDYGWWWLVVLALAPDLSFVAYVAGPRVGAVAYNLAHTTVGPILLGVVGVVGDARGVVRLALIWLVHIGVDRLLGYGLKYPTAFKDTHLQRV